MAAPTMAASTAPENSRAAHPPTDPLLVTMTTGGGCVVVIVSVVPVAVLPLCGAGVTAAVEDAYVCGVGLGMLLITILSLRSC